MNYRLQNGIVGYSLDDDRLPNWANELAETIKDEHGLYDSFVQKYLKKALEHIHETILTEGEAKMPAPTPLELAPERLDQWFKEAPDKRLQYVDRGRNEYFDRLSLDNDEEHELARQVGAKLEFQDLVKEAYQFLKERDMISEMKNELNLNDNKEAVEE